MIDDMKKVITILLLSWICMAYKCVKEEDSENCHFSIKFSNNSKIDIRVAESSYLANSSGSIVKSGELDNRRALSGRDCLEYDFFFPSYIYVFNADLLAYKSWDEIVQNKLYLKLYVLHLEDLQRLDWKITYPPTEAMKDIEQYPPYSSE
jgi:hypothetical protein